MISENELINLLCICYAEINSTEEPIVFDNPTIILELIAQTLIRFSHEKQMPDHATLAESEDAKNLFKDIMQDLYAKIEKVKQQVSQWEQKLLPARQDFIQLSNPEARDYAKINKIISCLCTIKDISFSNKGNFERNNKLKYKDFQKGIAKDADSETYASYVKATTWFIAFLENAIKEARASSPQIDYAHINNLTKISLELHSKKYLIEASTPNSYVHIIHFYNSSHDGERSPKARASEFLDSFNSDNEADESISFDRTNHGLGSGVYGIGKLNEEMINERIRRKSNFKIFKIDRPLRLIDDKESEQLTEISKYLQRVGDELKALRFRSKNNMSLFSPIVSREQDVRNYFTSELKKENLIQSALILRNFANIKIYNFSLDDVQELLIKSMIEWFNDAKTNTTSNHKMVAMPINYVMKNLNFTGIISTINDSFNRGLIALKFTSDDSDLHKMSARLSPTRKSPSSRKYSLGSEEENYSSPYLLNDTF
jgi:hypothetical protein